jgi:hypothetical protein
LLEENERIEGLLSEDKLGSKRKYNEVLSEVNEYRDKVDKAMKSNAALEAKVVECEGKLEKESREKGVLNAKIE